MSGIPAGAIVHVGGKTVLNRLQNVGLQDPKVPTQIVYETGNNLAVGKILTEADFRFQMTSWDVSTDLMALLTGESATALGDQISGADDAGTVYKWEDVGAFNLTSPWKSNTGSQGGNIEAGVIIPNLYPTALSYRLGVTDNAEMQVTLASGSYFMAEKMPLEEYATGDGTTAAFQTANTAGTYRIGGAGSTNYMHVFGVMVDGVQQIPGIDYTESGGANADVTDTKVTITFAVIPGDGAIVKYCYFSDTAAAIPQDDNLPASATLPAAVRGRDITLLVGDPHGTGDDAPLSLYGVQTFELQASVSGSLLRQMGTQDPIGFANTGIDTTGTVTIEPASIEKLFQFMSASMGIAESEVYGYINQFTFPLTAVIHEPGGSDIIKSIFVPDAFFQAPGENARVQTVTQYPISFESMTGTFHEVKGDLPTVGE
jgi:hypothetical protein